MSSRAKREAKFPGDSCWWLTPWHPTSHRTLWLSRCLSVRSTKRTPTARVTQGFAKMPKSLNEPHKEQATQMLHAQNSEAEQTSLRAQNPELASSHRHEQRPTEMQARPDESCSVKTSINPHVQGSARTRRGSNKQRPSKQVHCRPSWNLGPKPPGPNAQCCAPKGRSPGSCALTRKVKGPTTSFQTWRLSAPSARSS